MSDLLRCTCPEPVPKIAKPSACVKCGHLIDPAWTSSDQTVAEFFDAYERCLPEWPNISDSTRTFRIHAEQRERAGRRTFGMAYLNRENLPEAKEEVVDLALYVMLDYLREVRREATSHYETDVAMQLVHHAAESYRLLGVIAAKRHGAP